MYGMYVANVTPIVLPGIGSVGLGITLYSKPYYAIPPRSGSRIQGGFFIKFPLY